MIKHNVNSVSICHLSKMCSTSTDSCTGEKTKEQKEACERDAKNQRSAGLAYTTPDPEYMDADYELSGLPWGSLSLKHVVERGNARERESQQGSQTYYGYGGSGRGSESRSR